ncbi:hypothetical protein ACFW2Y_08575 [Streptomyces sp. NPDC058877]|uniref:hypothetical protein n=1 Tax=unclassified Streptomyces TaxID=2593676 RepID=UPI0036911207
MTTRTATTPPTVPPRTRPLTTFAVLGALLAAPGPGAHRRGAPPGPRLPGGLPKAPGRPDQHGSHPCVAPDGTVLFVGSAVDFEAGLKSFRDGQRTPREQVEADRGGATVRSAADGPGS